MAITALATQNTQVGPSQFADLMETARTRFVVDSQTDLMPVRVSNTSVRLNPGAAFAAGTRIRSTGYETVTVPAVSSGTRYFFIVLRINWSSSEVTTQVLQSSSTTPPLNNASTANSTQLNRIPGVMYDALVAVCTATRNSLTVADYRCWGGFGGPYRVSNEAIASPSLLDARPGTWIETDRSLVTKRKDDDNTWRAIGTEANPWRTWNPVLRYYRREAYDGSGGGIVATHGNGAQVSARYRVVDGLLDGFIFIKPGNTGALWGDGQMTIDLPLRCAAWQEDTWSMGHLYNAGYGADGNFDWTMQMLVKKNWNRGLLFAPKSGADCRLEPYRVSDPFRPGPGTGVPFVAGGYPVGFITMHAQYPVEA